MWKLEARSCRASKTSLDPCTFAQVAGSKSTDIKRLQISFVIWFPSAYINSTRLLSLPQIALPTLAKSIQAPYVEAIDIVPPDPTAHG
jgi:hypothetical protein